MKQTEKRKKLRHTLLLGLMTLAALLLTMTMLGCDPDDEHEHAFNGTGYDEINHWETCKCEATKNFSAHVYDDESDTTCNVCNFVRTGHMHVWEDTWNTDDGYHWHNCTVSGCTTVNKSNHTLSSTTYVTDVNQHWLECNDCKLRLYLNNHEYRNDSDPKCDVCGYVRDIVHVHEWVLNYGDFQHWYRCLDCPETKDYEDHQFSSKLGYGNYYHYYKCIKCSIQYNEERHNYTWKYNAANHWQECICGKKTETKSHVYDNASDPSCNTCGYIRKLHDHVWQTEWNKDTGFHWHDCTIEGCKEKSNYTAHSYTWKDGIDGHFGECICGATTATENHVYDSDWDSTCNICGHLRYIYIPTPDPIVPPHSHNWVWTNDDDNHWKKCNCGEEKTEEKAYHNYPNGSGSYTSDAQDHWIECTICGYEQADSRQEHNPIMNDTKPVWYSDPNDHWQECNDCKYKLAVEPHNNSGENGSCSVCNYGTAPSPD